MFTQFNIVIQALVWTTLAGLMYAVWLHMREPMGKYNLGLSFEVRNVTHLLQTLWMLLAISLIISLIVLTLPARVQSARTVDTPCSPTSAVIPDSTNADQSLNPACNPSVPDAAKVVPDSGK